MLSTPKTKPGKRKRQIAASRTHGEVRSFFIGDGA
jgi:hypothetical protein